MGVVGESWVSSRSPGCCQRRAKGCTRSQHRSALTRQLFTNPWLWAAVALCIVLQLAAGYVPYMRAVLGTVLLDACEWAVVVAFAFAPIALVELTKWATVGAARHKTSGPRAV